MKHDLQELSAKVKRATAAGMTAAEACPDDGGSANLDHVCLYGLKGVREASLRKAGINGYRGSRGTFHLYAPFPGQGNRRYAGVQAMHQSLANDGVACYVFYQLD